MQNFGRDEVAALQLRQLFEQRGFRRVRVNKFEEYGLYVNNKNFLDTDSMITFMDLDGKLLALKPDVTLSIIKNIPKKAVSGAQKLYYQDEVYRLSRENRQYKVVNQIGVELIGPADDLANLEIIDLALESLQTISKRSLLDISHLGFVSGLLEEIGLSHREEREIVSCIHAKNTYDLSAVLERCGVEGEHRHRILALTEIHGDFVPSLEKARGLVANSQMQEAFDELSQVAVMLKNQGTEGKVNLDFSVVNDLDYYNGLILRGYVEGIPKLVLTGGRYDNMMRKMGKASSAIGFAISLDELSTYLKTGKSHDFDMLITYPEDCDYAALLECRRRLCSEGKSVRLEREGFDPAETGVVCKAHMQFVDGELIAGEGSKC